MKKFTEYQLILLEKELGNFISDKSQPLSITKIHGFLCAVASLPVPPGIEKILSVIFNGHRPSFDSPKAIKNFLELLFLFQNDIIKNLSSSNTLFTPLIWENSQIMPYKDTSYHHLTQWCSSYIEPIAECYRIFDNLDNNSLRSEELISDIAPILIFCQDSFEEFDEEIKKMVRENAKKEIPYVISFIHEIGYEIRKNHITENIKQEKIGRNILCPCGSGKKFKKCCLN